MFESPKSLFSVAIAREILRTAFWANFQIRTRVSEI